MWQITCRSCCSFRILDRLADSRLDSIRFLFLSSDIAIGRATFPNRNLNLPCIRKGGAEMIAEKSRDGVESVEEGDGEGLHDWKTAPECRVVHTGAATSESQKHRETIQYNQKRLKATDFSDEDERATEIIIT
uniref:Uncharacterized protein n=1 Tax=Kalanchoe fedtschenkoi TaxID=63787 RepID=A0A7N0UI09_KALFE